MPGGPGVAGFESCPGTHSHWAHSLVLLPAGSVFKSGFQQKVISARGRLGNCIFYDFQITTAAVFLDLLRTQEISAVLHRISSQKQKDQLFPHEVG